MKRTILFASAAVVAMAASAQIACSPSTDVVLEKGKVGEVFYLDLAQGAIDQFAAQGATMVNIGPDDVNNHLYIWPETPTMNVVDAGVPRVDLEEGGFVCYEIGTQGWSGAGYNDNGIDISAFDENTRFHLGYIAPTNNGPASICLIIVDGGDYGSLPAKVALGDPFNDNGVIPSVAPKANDEWQGIDISFADLKKYWPTFTLNNLANWKGNIVSFLGGAVTGQIFGFDTIYFYNLGGASVNEFGADAEGLVVSENTVSALNGNGIELYALDGKLVKSTAGNTLGLNDLNNGVYVARCGSKTQKIVVR